ncbi:MAG: hypothetical protein KDC65_03215 [Saprospiraceae bacterium]|nr:hypothetical protein [Saprospiraceae bacterium]
MQYARLALIVLGLFHFWGRIEGQKVERKLLYTAPSRDELPFVRTVSSDGMFISDDLVSDQCMFFVEERNGYRVFHDGQDIGLFTKKLGFEPQLEYNGMLFLPEEKDGQYYLRVNGRSHGPFTKVLDISAVGSHFMVKHADPAKKQLYYYIDSVNRFQEPAGLGFRAGRIDKAGNFILQKDINMRNGSTTAYLNGELLCENCGIAFNDAAGNHAFFMLQTMDEKKQVTYLVDGEKQGPIDSYWVPGIDKFGNFTMLYWKDGEEYVQANKEHIGPLQNVKGVRRSTGAFGVLFKFRKAEEPANNRYLYDNGQIYGPLDSIELVPYSDMYYYEKNGGKFVGRKGAPVFEIPADQGLTTLSCAASGRYMLGLTDGSVYLNEQLMKKYASVHLVKLDSSGHFYIQAYDKKGRPVVNLDGREFTCAEGNFGWNFFFHVSNDYRHFFWHQNGSDNMYIDGKPIPQPSPWETDASYYYLESINAFCWLTKEGNSIYWHTVKLD